MEIVDLILKHTAWEIDIVKLYFNPWLKYRIIDFSFI